jgi:hypothetical protein
MPDMLAAGVVFSWPRLQSYGRISASKLDSANDLSVKLFLLGRWCHVFPSAFAEPLVGTWPWRDAVPSIPRQGNRTTAYEQLLRPTMAQPASLVPASRPGPGTCIWVPVPSSVGPWAEVMLHRALDT